VTLPRPKALLVFSAHWETMGFVFGETETHTQLIYDFGGFPEALYQVKYPAPGDPWLADAVEARLGIIDRQINRSQRGLDHGVWVPLVHMWPDADVPILQMTMPRVLSNADLYDLGRRLAPLRDEGIIIIGSGTLTHNLGEFRPNHSGPPLVWAADFDQ
jgi:4,5-DOPA dioxygenase extradiol